MASNSGEGRGHGGNGGSRGGRGRGGNGGSRGDRGSASSLGPGTYTFLPTGVEGSGELWLSALALPPELGPALAKLYHAEKDLRVANAAFMTMEDRAAVRRVVAKAAYDVAYDEYKAVIDHATSAQP